MYIRIIFLLSLSFLLFSCSSTTKVEDNNSNKESVVFDSSNSNDQSKNSWWNPVSWFSSSQEIIVQGDESNNKANTNNKAGNNNVVNGNNAVISSKKNVGFWEKLFPKNKHDNLMQSNGKSVTLEEKEQFRVESIDKEFKFKSNATTDYYGLVVTVLRMPSDWKKEAKHDSVFLKSKSNVEDDNDKKEDPNTNAEEISVNYASSPEELEIINSEKLRAEKAVKSHETVDKILHRQQIYRSNIARDIKLSVIHEGVLDKLISNFKDADKKLVIVFVKGSNLKSWDSSAFNMERTVYTQYVLSYLNANFENVRVEKRYLDDIPKDEIFIVTSKYQGSLPYNMYNAPKQSIAQWLARYRDFELERIKKDLQDKKEIEALISGSTAISPEVTGK